MTDYWNKGEIAHYEMAKQGYQANLTAIQNRIAAANADAQLAHAQWEAQHTWWEQLPADTDGGKPPEPIEPAVPPAEQPVQPVPPELPAPFAARQATENETITTPHGDVLVQSGSWVLSRGDMSFGLGEADLGSGYTTEPPAA